METIFILPLLTGIEWVIIGGVVLFVIVLVAFRAKNLIAASSLNLSVPKDGSANLTVTLLRKGWFTSKLKPTSGTLKHLSGSLIVISPTSPITINRVNRTATLQITGIARGTGTITLNGTSRGGNRSHDTLVVKYTVT
ncbi:hypothetical protein [uncultured Tenacibaculum sp.]|uniref:hypothetical protein n=1 Tax=uncultured Tenacibaculum sp. TaxID=174713 RepID=UPI0026393E9F|nr:hypothetical protein [uncultured Tenacibaculum sp.]